MNSILADEYTLFTKTLNYHWNVTGPRFYSIHEFLENHYRSLLEVIDDVAERIREVEGVPIGTLKDFKKKSSIVESANKMPDASGMISDLMSDHQLLQTEITSLLEYIKKCKKPDPGSEDFFGRLVKMHEEMSWKLKSHLN
ncbi:MAG: DNA starvation/stationary phase protection protein [Bdellovibrionales bacterium]